MHLRRETVAVRSSKIVISIAEALQREGFIKEFEIVKSIKTPAQNDVKIFLKYGRSGEQVINLIERVSTPGRRIYSPFRICCQMRSRNLANVSVPIIS